MNTIIFLVIDTGSDSLLVKLLTAGIVVMLSFCLLLLLTLGRREATVNVLAKPRTIKHDISLSLVLPAYNESDIVQKTIANCIWSLVRMVNDFEILVVDDGSTDGTAGIVKTITTYESRVKLFCHQENQGYGAALSTGFAKATKQYTMYMDSDGQFDIRDLNSMLPLLSSYDGVFGYRVDRQDAWIRKINAWGWNVLVRFVFRLSIKDVDCAFKILRTDYFREVALESRGALLSTEIVYKFIRAGYTYTQAAVHHFPRKAGKSAGASKWAIVQALGELTHFASIW